MARRALYQISWRVWVIGAVAAGALLWFSPRAPFDGLAIGAAVPRFSLPTSAGAQVGVESFPHQVRLLNFWSTTCGPCVMEIPSLNRLAAHFVGRPFQILAISEDGDQSDPWGTIARFQERIPLQFPVVLDADGRVADQYGTYVIPESFLLDHSGRLVKRITGAIRWDDPQLVAEIEQLVREAP